MKQSRHLRDVLFHENALLLYLALFKIVLHLIVNDQYGFMRDELGYMDDAKHLAWGYVDHPPLAPWIGSAALELSGDRSLVGLRLFASLATAGTLVLAGLMVRQLGGGKWAQVLAALATMFTGISLSAGVLFQAVPFDQFWWVLCSYFVLLLVKTEDPRYWLGIGLVIGAGLLTKYTIVYYILGLTAAMLLTRQFKYVRSPYFWLGGLLALLIFLPNVIWLEQNDWVSFDHARSINARDIALGRTDGYLPEQFLINMIPLAFPLWIAGLYFYFFSKDGQRYRALGWIHVVVVVALFVTRGRAYYANPVYPLLMAAGAVVIERLAQKHGRWIAVTATSAVIAGSIPIMPVVLPILQPGSELWETVTELNPDQREMIGWEELAATVGMIYQGLPEDERAYTAILAGNTGEAGAINLYGRDHGLPPVISPVNSYYYWSQGRLAAETYIVIGYHRNDLRAYCGEITQAGRISNRYGIENEETRNHAIIYLCRAPRTPLEDIWPDMQRFG